jgi:hypothetical protein
MANLAVLIVKTEVMKKLGSSDWLYWAEINEDDYNKYTDAVEKIQEAGVRKKQT